MGTLDTRNQGTASDRNNRRGRQRQRDTHKERNGQTDIETDMHIMPADRQRHGKRDRELETERIMLEWGTKQEKREERIPKDKTNQLKRCGFLLVVKCKGLVVSVKL